MAGQGMMAASRHWYVGTAARKTVLEDRQQRPAVTGGAGILFIDAGGCATVSVIAG